MEKSLDLLYKTLEIESNAKKSEIKKAYRTLSKEHHPDHGGDPEKFKAIKEAYEILMDDEKKKAFLEGTEYKSTDKKVKDFIISIFYQVINKRFVADFENLISKMDQEINEQRQQGRSHLESAENDLSRMESIRDRIKKGDILKSAISAEIERIKEKINHHNDTINIINMASDKIKDFEYMNDEDNEIIGALDYESKFTR